MTRRRDVTEDELALWHRAMRGTTPLPGRGEDTTREAPPAVPAPAAPAAPRRPRKPAAVSGRGREKVQREKVPAAPGGGLDAASQRRLRRGRIEVDGRVDLHGLRQGEAYSVLTRFIAESQAAGRRCVLVITGKGGRPAEGEFGHREEEGVLRRQVPLWLQQAPTAARIFAVEPAHKRHGGAGALYVFLRKAKRDGRD